MLKEAIQVALIIFILDRIGFVDGDPWLETHLDTLSVQATLFSGKTQSWLDRLKAHIQFTRRVEKD